jgi:hypothetical protein
MECGDGYWIGNNLYSGVAGMRLLIALLLSLCATGALAQGCGPQNPNCIVPSAGVAGPAASVPYVTSVIPVIPPAITSLTGPVTATGPGAAATTITAGAVTSGNLASGAAAANVGTLGGSLTGTLPNPGLAASSVANSNLANMAAKTLKGTIAGGTPADLTAQLVQTVLAATQCLNITSSAFGGAGDNSTDNTTPLNTALAALTGNGGCIFFPPGKYKLNSAISYSLPAGVFSVALFGGGQDNTVLTWPNASGGMTFTYAGTGSNTHFRDLSFTTGQVGGGTALTLTQSNTPQGQGSTDLYRVTFRGDDGYNVADYWNTGLAVQEVSNINIDAATFFGITSSGNHGIGITLSGDVAHTLYSTQVNVAKSIFQGLAQGILYGSYVQGVTVDQSNFTGVTTGIGSNGSETGVLAQLSVTNSQFAASGNAIITATAIVTTQLANNLFIQPANSTAIFLQASTHFMIVGNNITSLSVTGTQGIVIGPSGTGTIVGNDIFGFGGGINLQSGANGIVVSDNTLEGNTTNFTNSGTGNTGADLPWVAFTPAFTCGTATFTNNSSRSKTVGKLTSIQIDATITAIGTCSGNNVGWTLPNTPQSGGSVMGRETAISGYLFGCTVTSASASVLCSKFDASTTWAVNNRLQASGVYENQ